MLKSFIFFLFLTSYVSGSKGFAQSVYVNPSTVQIYPDSIRDRSAKNHNYLSLIIPASLVSIGSASLHMDALKKLNTSTRDEILEHQPRHLSIDNYTQYAPAAMVYALNLSGVKSEHNFRDRTIIYASSQLIAAAFVVPLKHLVKEERPDGSNTQSFPSGHTTTAFSSAQFLFREYKNENFWLSISGYPLAIFTGTYRVLNNRHWVGDVVAGAGLGILSTEIAYRIYPKMNSLLTPKGRRAKPSMIFPCYLGHNIGISFVKIL